MSIVTVQNIALGTKEEQDIRKMISNWSNKIPHHNCLNFGETLNIFQIINCPVYEIEISTQFYSSTIREKERPYRGESLNTGKPSSNSNLKTKTLREDKSVHIVAGSEKLYTCPACNGRGDRTCYSCSGFLKVSCYSCGGSGKKYETSGRWINGQYYSTSGYVTCSSCFGTGRVTCSVCHGTGKVTCNRCRGNGNIVCYWEETEKWDYSIFNNVIYHPIHHKEAFPHFQINKSLSRSTLVDRIENKLQKDDYALEPAHFYQSYTSVFDAAINSQKKMKIDRPGKILFQGLTINSIAACTVAYQYNSEKLHLIVFKDTNAVYDDNGPIAKIRNGITQKGKVIYQKKNFGKSIVQFAKAKEMDPDGFDTVLTALYNKANAKIKSSYFIGVFMGILLFGYFTLLFYADAIQNKDHFLSGWFSGKHLPEEDVYHAATGYGLLFLVLGFIQMPYLVNKLYKRWNTKLSPEILRIVTGFSLALVPVLIAALLICLLDKTGFVAGAGSFILNLF